LTVTGDESSLQAFVEMARIRDDVLRMLWEERLMPKADDNFEEFAKDARENQPLSFTSFVPEPEFTGEEVNGLFGMPTPDWHAWRTKNWGTKWDASFDGPAGAIVLENADVLTSVESQGATITKYAAFYKFDTAWSPPVPFVHTTSAQFPTLEFTLRYAEVGNGYAGQGIYKAGAIVEEIELEVEDVLAPEERWF